MAAGSSDDEYIDSNHDPDSAGSDSEGQDASAFAQSSASQQVQRQPRQRVRSQSRPVSPSCGLIEQPDAIVETSERQFRERKPRSRQPSQRKPHPRQSSGGQLSRSSRGRSQSSQSEDKVGATLTTAYRDLLNDMIADATGRPATLKPALTTTQVGMSIWSAYEKRFLFDALERYGAGNLPKLTSAVRTKSQYEIQAYLSLLQQGSALQNNSASWKGVHLTEIQAAVEVSEDCELALNTAADILSSRVEVQEQLAAHAKLGDDWLIDGEVADAEDETYEQALATDAEVVDDDGVPTSDAEHASSDRANLLRSAAFLQLSRNLFMNNGDQRESNWHYVDKITDATDEPAIFRRALDDLRALTISLTRRLVQASIFQTMTRLRACDSARADWTPLTAVRDTDVKSAMELLNMGPDWHNYWAKVARRCRVSVFSNSMKYHDGRPGTKAGFLLREEEVEIELGMDESGAERNDDEVSEEPGSHESGIGSDAYTDVSEDSSWEEEDAAGGCRTTTMNGFSSTRKRKRPLSLSNLARIEDESAEDHDQTNSMREQVRLWEMLRLEPPHSLLGASTATKQSSLVRPGVQPVSTAAAWRNTLVFQAPWEHELTMPVLQEFQSMTARGRKGQNRRRMFQDQLNGSSDAHRGHIFDDRNALQRGDSGDHSVEVDYEKETNARSNDGSDIDIVWLFEKQWNKNARLKETTDF